MAVDYLRYAQMTGNRNPIAEGLSSLGETLDKGFAQKRQNMLDQRQMRLSDLQMQREQMALDEATREQEYKQGLRAAMTDPQSTTQFTPRPAVQPQMQVMPSALQKPAEFSMGQPEVSPAVQAYTEGRVKTTTESPAAAGARYAMSQGKPDEALKMVSVDDALAQYGAKIQAGGGDPRQYYTAKNELDQAKEAFNIIKEFKGQPALLKAMWPALSKAYPNAANIDLDNIEYKAEGIVFKLKNPDGTPVPGKSYFYDNQGKMHLVEDKQETQEKWSEPYMDKVGGKTVMLQKSSTGQIKPVVQDTSTTVKVNTGTKGQQTDFKNESSMRKEFLTLPEVKEFPIIEQNSKRALKALAEQGKGSNVAVDQSIITVFNKMLDPSSVVRESEYARTPQDLSVLSRIRGKWDKIQRGGAGLDSNERQALYRMIKNFNEIANEQYNDQVEYYSGLATRYGYKPENIVRLGGRKAPTPGNSGQPVKGGGLKPDGKGGYVWQP